MLEGIKRVKGLNKRNASRAALVVDCDSIVAIG
jgi:hypothetical protein